MAKCEICEKSTLFGNKVSHSEIKTRRTFKPNIRRVRIDDNGTVRKANICASCLKSEKVKRA